MAGAIPIQFRRMVGREGAAPMARIAENNNVTVKEGVPVALAGGYVQASGALNANTSVFLGFSTEYGKNRTTAGTAQTLTQGSVRSQANASVIPIGVAMDDGKMGVLLPGAGVRFMGALTSNNNVAAAQLGAVMGLTQDSNNYWYIDPAKDNLATGGCLKVTDLVDPIGTAGGKLEFEVISTRLQLINL